MQSDCFVNPAIDVDKLSW